MRSTTSYHLFRNTAEIFELARHLSNHFGNSNDILIGIHELLLNAVEHGNLRIDGSLKIELLREGRFAQEIDRRLRIHENANKYVKIDLHENRFFRSLSIHDQGDGFDWASMVQPSGDISALNGRGLLIAQHSGFDIFRYNATGNCVTCLSWNAKEIEALCQCPFPSNCEKSCVLLGYCEEKNAAAA